MTTRMYGTEQEWLAERNNGLGSSDAAAVLGLDPWKSAIQLWGEKAGHLDAEHHDAGEEFKFWGKILERPIAEKYSIETRREVLEEAPFTMHFMDEDERLRASLDRLVEQNERHPDSGQGLLEIKNVSQFKGGQWADGASPLWYQVQVQHQFLVTGFNWGSFAILIGGNQFGWQDVFPSEKFMAYLLEKEQEFLDFVKRDVPPPVDASQSAKETIARLYPQDSGETIVLTLDATQWDEELQDVKAQQKDLEEKRRLLENQIKNAIGEATFGTLMDGTQYSLKTIEAAGYTVEPKRYRRLWRHK